MHLVLGTIYPTPILYSELDTACCENKLSLRPVNLRADFDPATATRTATH